MLPAWRTQRRRTTTSPLLSKPQRVGAGKLRSPGAASSSTTRSGFDVMAAPSPQPMQRAILSGIHHAIRTCPTNDR